MKNVSEIMFRWCLTYDAVYINGSIDASDGTIFDVYLFSDCLNENILFCKTIPIHFKHARTKLHMGKTNPESLEEIH